MYLVSWYRKEKKEKWKIKAEMKNKDWIEGKCRKTNNWRKIEI
jgi:hypothetical protein